jgi:hypothetical protein
MGRAHQIGMEIGIGLLYVIAVVTNGISDATDMVVGVVAYAMTLADHALVEFRVFAHLVAYHEEGGFDVVFGQYVKHKRSGLGYGTVVEGQIDGLLVTVHAPKCLRI